MRPVIRLWEASIFCLDNRYGYIAVCCFIEHLYSKECAGNDQDRDDYDWRDCSRMTSVSGSGSY